MVCLLDWRQNGMVSRVFQLTGGEYTLSRIVTVY